MAERVGRNEPCPCGSGKKFKKCHGLLNQTNVEQLVNDELEQLIGQFYNRLPVSNLIRKNASLLEEWEQRLSPFYDLETIHSQGVDYMYFLQSPEYWQSHVRDSMATAVRPALKHVLSGWERPMCLFGVVESIHDGQATLEDTLGSGTYTLKVPQDMELSEGEAVMGHFLADNRAEGRIMLMNGLVFLESRNSDVVHAARQLRESEQAMDQQEFLKRHALDLYEMIGRDEAVIPATTDRAKKEKPGNDESGAAILSLIVGFLRENDVESTALEERTRRFLERAQPKARKPESVAAGAIRFGQINGLLEDLKTPKAKVAEHFEVSSSTVQKYADDMMKFEQEHAKL